MPLYEYKCTECSKFFEKVMPIDQRHLAVCDCGQPASLRISAPAVITIAGDAVIMQGGKVIETQKNTGRQFPTDYMRKDLGIK